MTRSPIKRRKKSYPNRVTVRQVGGAKFQLGAMIERDD